MLVAVVHGPSMLPTYHDGDRLIARRRRWAVPRRGDVVVFRNPRPAGVPGSSQGPLLIKRVSAGPHEAAPVGMTANRVPARHLVMLLTACGWPYMVQEWSVDQIDLPEQRYPTGMYPRAVEVSRTVATWRAAAQRCWSSGSRPPATRPCRTAHPPPTGGAGHEQSHGVSVRPPAPLRKIHTAHLCVPGTSGRTHRAHWVCRAYPAATS